MNLKKTILAAMVRDDLKAAVQAAGLDGADRRSARRCRNATGGFATLA